METEMRERRTHVTPPETRRPARRAAPNVHHRAQGFFALMEDLAHYAISVLLVIVAGYVLFHTAAQLIMRGSADYATRTTDAINGILLVIIITEILSTVIAHFNEEGFQLKPFLIIGIISAVRHILTIGAQLSVGADAGPTFYRTQIELGVSAGVVVALVLALVVVRRSDQFSPGPD
jgi:uncharacterized membrane protein (DUF373 family)